MIVPRAFLIIMITLLSSCIKPIVVDKLHDFVIVGFGKPPKKIKPSFITMKNFPIMAKPKDTISAWLATVSANEIKKCIPNVSVKLSLVNSFGEVVLGEFIQPTEIISNSKGRNTGSILLSFNVPGVYRIKLEYKDERTISIGYSNPIIIMNSTLPIQPK